MIIDKLQNRLISGKHMYTAKIDKLNTKHCNDNWLIDNSSPENVFCLEGDCKS